MQAKERDFKENKELLSRFEATLIGSALGDTLGMPVEGWTREQIARHVGAILGPRDPVVVKDAIGNIIKTDEDGRIPYISANLRKGQWTDDTWLAAITARSIVESDGLDITSLVKHSLIVYEQRKDLEKTGGDWGCFGGTTEAGFENLKKGIAPDSSGVMSRNPGNATALKTAPIGLYMHATGEYEAGLQFAQKVGLATHLDARSVVSGVVQAHAVYLLLSRLSRNEFLESVLEVARLWEKSEEQGKKVTLWERLQWVYDNHDINEEEAYHVLGPGWAVTRNYPFTIYMFCKYWDNPLAGMVRLVNYGGDCDSTCALYGALAGARFGTIFPQSWLEVLEGKEELTVLGQKIYRMFKKRVE